MAVYNKAGNRIDEYLNLNYDATILSVNHRGYSTVAPENTLPAYRLSKQMGFNYVETDVAFTSDGVAMLLHDATIDRTSNGTGALGSMTYAQVRQYDFGSWKGPEYAGTVIPTLDEFLTLCKDIMLFPYIELKNNEVYTEAQIRGIVDAVKAHGMTGKVTYISFSSTYLGYVKNYDPAARLGFLKTTAAAGDVSTVTALQTGSNDVFLDTNFTKLTTTALNAFISAGIPVEVYTVNTDADIQSLPAYISGITSDSKIAGQVLYETNA